MTATEADASVRFDPFEDGFTEWPYDQYARLRAADPVHRSEVLQGWVLTRYADVDRLLKDPATSSVIDNATPTTNTQIEIERRAEMEGGDASPLPLLDEPDHTRVRRQMAPTFRKGAVRDLNETIERRVDELLDAVVERHGSSGTFDLVSEFAYPMPVMVICELMGIPDEDGPTFRRWVQLVAEGLDPVISAEGRDASLAAGDEMRAYLRQQVAAKRAKPTDDLTSALVEASDSRDDGGGLSADELIAQLQTIYIAGHEPVTAVLGNGFRGLLVQPDQLAAVGNDPSLIENAVVELLRFDGPNQFVRRIAMADLHFDGGVVPAGAVVYPGIAAVNHDPAVFGPDADVIRVDRTAANRHLQFGAGIHGCLGTHLAKLEIELAMRHLLTRFGSLELAGEPTWANRMVLRSVNELHVHYDLR